MAEVASAFVSLVPSARGFGKGIQGQIGGDLDRVGRSSGVRFGNAMSTGLGSTTRRIFAPLAAAAAGIGLVSFFKGAIGGASDLNETISKTDQIFGKASGAVQAFAADSTKNILLTKQEALDAAATFGIFGRSAGLTGKGLSGFSTQLTGLASDLASFNNTSPQQAIEAIGAALRGESEPIRAYGVLLDDATLRQSALRLGLIKTTKTALKPQQRVLAAQAEILRQTSLQQGDAARTAGGFANQSKILHKQLTDLKTGIGTGLLPVATRFVSFLNTSLVPGIKVFFNALRGKSELNEFDGALRAVNDAAIRIREGFQTVAGFVTKTLVPAIKTGFDKVKAPMQATLDFVTQTLVPGVVKKFGEIKTAFSEMLDGVDFGSVGGDLFRAAKSWAGDLINGVQVGLDTGDWSPLGKTIGEKIIQAVQGAAKVSGEIAAAVGDLLSKVKWVDIGVSLGKQVPSLLAGLAIGILTLDVVGLLKGLGDHWFEALLAALTVAFLPARVIGAVAGLLARIPLVGPLLAWMLNAFRAVARPVFDGIGRFLGFVGEAFLAGFRTVFPKVGSAFSTFVKNLPTYLRVLAAEFKEKGVAAMGGLFDGLAAGVFRVAAKVGEIAGDIIRYFSGAGTWLLAAGGAIVTGLIVGIGDKLADLWAKIQEIPDGIKSRLGSAFKFGSPSKVTAEMGGWIAQGLAQGMDQSLGTVRSAAGRLTAGARPMTSRLTAGGVAVGATGSRGGVHIEKVEVHANTWAEIAKQTQSRARLAALAGA